jgi:hypothetical protein
MAGYTLGTLCPTCQPSPVKGGAFPDGVTPGELKQRRTRFARLEFGDFVDAFTPARIVGNRQKWDAGLHGHPVFPLEGEGPVVSPVTHRYDPPTERAFGLDAGNGADSKILVCLMLRGATALRLPSRVTVLNLRGLRPILHRLRGRRMRDIRNLRAVFPGDTRAGNRIEDNEADQVERLLIGTGVQGSVAFRNPCDLPSREPLLR